MRPAIPPALLEARLTSPTRLAALRATGLLDAEPDVVLDRLTRFATRLLGVPTASVTLVDDRRQRSAGRADPPGREPASREAALAYSYCQYVVATNEPLVIVNAGLDPLVRENLGFTELGVVSYAGVPLITADGETLGSLCAMAPRPHAWTTDDVDTLRDLASAAMAEIELRTTARALADSQDRLRENEARLRELATHDDLTGLLNRRGFAEHARQQMAVAARSGADLQVLVLDLDGFKEINDRLGHDVGDLALVEMAGVLSRTVRASDVVARMGGDEFAILAATPNTDVGGLTARLGDAIASYNAHAGRAYVLATSIGASRFDAQAPASLEQLLRDADAAMYEAKRRRKASAARDAA